VPLDDLQSAALTGLVIASQKFDPTRAAFGACARPWIKGECTALFKQAKSAQPPIAIPLDKTIKIDGEEGRDSVHDLVADPKIPAASIDVGGLTEKERGIVLGRSQGQTLIKLGKQFGISQERVRQLEAKATEKLRRKKGNVALACIRDLITRRGYRKPLHELLPFRRRTYPCRVISRAEIVTFVASRPDLGEARR
jgi:RNA polymerase sigma factor (sigma-70 family)